MSQSVKSWGGLNCEACGGVCEAIKHPGQGCRGPVGATGDAIQALYDDLRDAGCSHDAALRSLYGKPLGDA